MRTVITTVMCGLTLGLAACGETVRRNSAIANSLPTTEQMPLLPCSDQSNPPQGPTNYYCIDEKLLDKRSYCLRRNGDRPLHVRRWVDDAAVVTAGESKHATFDKICEAPVNTPCKKHTAIAKVNEHLVVTPHSPGKLDMTIADQPTIVMDVDKSKLFARGADAEWEYFLLLADDQLGDTRLKNQRRIERYLVVEAFDVRDTSRECEDEKPKASNFHRWWGNQNKCVFQTCPSENGTGGGGHDYP